MSNLTVSSTAADLRAWFNDPRYGASRQKALAKVREGALTSVVSRDNLRGRIAKEAVDMFNAHPSNVKAGRAYFTGATKEAVHTARTEALRARVTAFEKGEAVGARGPLSNAARAAAGLPVIVKKAPKSRKGK